jgi:hypothetical protein
MSETRLLHVSSMGSRGLRIEMRDSLRAALEGMSTSERQMLRLWLEGERRTSVLAAAAGISNRDQADRAHRVKAIKDRFRQRLRRLNGTRA